MHRCSKVGRTGGGFQSVQTHILTVRVRTATRREERERTGYAEPERTSGFGSVLEGKFQKSMGAAEIEFSGNMDPVVFHGPLADEEVFCDFPVRF